MPAKRNDEQHKQICYGWQQINI